MKCTLVNRQKTQMKLQSHLSSMLLSRGDVREHSAFNVIPCVIYEYIRTIFKADGNCVVDGGFSATKFLKKIKFENFSFKWQTFAYILGLILEQ